MQKALNDPALAGAVIIGENQLSQADYGIAVFCDVCHEQCPSKPFIEKDKIICLGCAARRDVEAAFSRATATVSPHKMHKLLRRSRRKDVTNRGQPIPDSRWLSVVTKTCDDSES